MTNRSVPLAVALLFAAVPASASAAANGGTSAAPQPVPSAGQGGTAYGSVPLPARPPKPPPRPSVAPVGSAVLAGAVARAPRSAPRVVKLAIAAANRLQVLPYRFGGGHASFKDTAYDCSGTVSYMLHGAGLLASPLDSTEFVSWGLPGSGRWITIYANAGHAYAVVAGLRLDTAGGAGPRWHAAGRSGARFTARHPAGL